MNVHILDGHYLPIMSSSAVTGIFEKILRFEGLLVGLGIASIILVIYLAATYKKRRTNLLEPLDHNKETYKELRNTIRSLTTGQDYLTVLLTNLKFTKENLEGVLEFDFEKDDHLNVRLKCDGKLRFIFEQIIFFLESSQKLFIVCVATTTFEDTKRTRLYSCLRFLEHAIKHRFIVFVNPSERFSGIPKVDVITTILNEFIETLLTKHKDDIEVRNHIKVQKTKILITKQSYCDRHDEIPQKTSVEGYLILYGDFFMTTVLIICDFLDILITETRFENAKKANSEFSSQEPAI